MNDRKLSFGLGLFSIALGPKELLVAPKIARGLSSSQRERLVPAFGTRELVVGGGMLAAPAHSAGVWGRVPGDIFDIAALGDAARRTPRSPSVAGATDFVLSETAPHVFLACGLDWMIGKFHPGRMRAA